MASISKREDKWLARVRIKGTEGIAKSFRSKADAEAWARITESEIIRGLFIKRTDAERTTLAEALRRYEEEVTPGKRGKDTEKLRIKAWKADKLAKKPLAMLRPYDFAQWRDKRLKQAQPGTVRRELGLISNLFNIARKEWGYDGLQNPIESIRMPVENNARNRTFYEGEEVLLLEALDNVERESNGHWSNGCRNVWLKPLVLLALETACRRGELLSLRWENINLSDRVLHLPMTKNGQHRDVPLSSKAVEIFKGLPRTLRGPVFPITANAVKLGFVRAVRRAGRRYRDAGGTDDRIMADLHFHDLRHIAVTRLAEKLPNIIELASVTGHIDVRMLRRYYHPKAEDLARKLG
jgi:integrase